MRLGESCVFLFVWTAAANRAGDLDLPRAYHYRGFGPIENGRPGTSATAAGGVYMRYN